MKTTKKTITVSSFQKIEAKKINTSKIIGGGKALVNKTEVDAKALVN